MENNKSKEKKKIKNSTKFTILAIILISIFCFAVTPITLQNDTYYTIKIGEHIQNNGKIFGINGRGIYNDEENGAIIGVFQILAL